MKRINTLLLTLMAAAAMTTWTSCNDEVEYTPADSEYAVYFSKDDPTNFTLEGTSGTLTVTIYRNSATGAAESATIISQVADGAASLFSIPSSVDFAEGAESASLDIDYNDLVRGTRYQITLSLGENASLYGEATRTLTVTYPEEVEEWDVVSTEAILIDNLFSMYSVTNLQITGITVEKNPNANQYRFSSPYDNSYFDYIYGLTIFPDDFEAPYIILDGEQYADVDPGSYYIAPTALGFDMVNGSGPEYDLTWNTFGSIAGNLSTSAGPITPPNSSYPLGSFDEATQMFDFGAVFHNLGGYGYYVLDAGNFQLYLDPDLMETDYDRDYTWEDVYTAAGTFTSTVDGEQQWQQTVQRSVEDPTFYRFQSLYAPGYHIYFNYDAAAESLSLLRSQPTGLKTNIGNQDIYVSGVSGGVVIDSDNPKLLRFNMSFFLADESGNTTAELVQAEETFLQGSVYGNFTPAADIDDYVGTWNVALTDGSSTVNVPVTVTKLQDDDEDYHLLVSGLSGMDGDNYDDTVELIYDEDSGYTLFSFQRSGDYFAGVDNDGDEVYYATYAALFDSQMFSIDTSGDEVLVGGITAGGDLQFVDYLGNESAYDGIVYLYTPNGSSLYLMSGYWAGFTWGYSAASATTYRQMALARNMKPVSSQKKAVSRRTYNTTLNLQPKKNTYPTQINATQASKLFMDNTK